MNETTPNTIESATNADFPEIVDVWEQSVRATHDFLAEADIQHLKPLILNEYLKAVELFVIRENGKILGFLGLSPDKIEMLFIRPDVRGKGVGKRLAQYAIREKGIRKVDVNEQNPQAVGFYRHIGFEVVSRSPLDPQGKPFPILSMTLKNQNHREDSMTIRTERESDYPAIYELIRTAFETADVKDGTEQDFAENLRKGPGYVPELALVAEINGKIVAHIMLTKTYVDGDGGRFEGLLLAPVSVQLEYRNHGVGSALIREALDRAGKSGFKAVFLAGDRNYYSRFGFVPARRFGIRCPQELPEDLLDNIMALELVSGVLELVSGTLDWPDDHEVDVESVREGLEQKEKR